MTLLTHDSIALRGAGVVYITQPKAAHRFTLDSLLLADFCRLRPRDTVLEPGTGSGIISILLARKFPASRLTAVEKEPEMANHARLNIDRNDLSSRVLLLEEDIRNLDKTDPAPVFDAIVTNPPYTKYGSGRRSPVKRKRVAREEISGSFEVWMDLQRFLRNRGRYFLIFPAARSGELISSLRSRKLEPKRARFVHSSPDKPALLILIEAIKAGGTGMEILPPLITHETNGNYSDEMQKIYGTKRQQAVDGIR